ncbi:MAG: WYL domain-containing protein [Cyclobacteriaceae bacterium]
MTSTTKILSYAAIIEYLEVHNKASSKHLRQKLEEHELPSSEATFERLKSDLKNFGVFLIYEDGSYRMEMRASPHQPTFFHVINLIKEVNLLQHLIIDGEAREKVILQSKEPPKFYDLIPQIFNSIIIKQKIRFDYEHFSKGFLGNLELNPLLLREYERRWYVIGFVDPLNQHRTFAIDRIKNLEVLKVKFKYQDYVGLTTQVAETYGVNYSEAPIKLVLKAHAPQNNYLRNLPLHDSQKEMGNGDGYTLYEYQLRPNYELQQELQKLADQITIIEPDWLRLKIVEKLKSGINRNTR